MPAPNWNFARAFALGGRLASCFYVERHDMGDDVVLTNDATSAACHLVTDSEPAALGLPADPIRRKMLR
jgi:hypothetical protein